MNEGFPEYRNRDRFPSSQPKGICRGCRGPIDPVLEPRAQTWHRACKKKFDPFHVKLEVRKRDSGKCVKCACQTVTAREWRRRYEEGCECLDGQREEFDHITPHCEGGLFVIENIRLVCKSCHRERTKEWHSARKVQPKFLR